MQRGQINCSMPMSIYLFDIYFLACRVFACMYLLAYVLFIAEVMDMGINGPVNRWFYRCTGCLEVVALDAQLRMEYSHSVATCSTCGQHFESMGRVTDNRLWSDKTECVCDDRCTSARGPICTCSCGGENHGCGMAGYITVSTVIGAAPQVTMPTTKGREKALAQYREFAELRATVKAELNSYLDRRAAGEFMPRPAFDRMRLLQDVNRKACAARSHAGRMKMLRSALAREAA